MAKYLIDSADIEIEEVSGTQNLKFNFKSGNTLETKINNLSNYSTTEQVIGKWIDNKPLYRKVINFGALPNNSQKSVNHNISNLDLVINLYGFGKRTLDGVIIPLQFVKPDDPTGEVGMFANNTEIIVVDTYDRSNVTISYVIIEYTKTTD